MRQKGKEGQEGQESWEGNTTHNKDKMPKSHG